MKRMQPVLKPGQMVRVRQQIDTREGAWASVVEGRVVRYERRPTGSWFAHGKNDRLWLQRLRIEKSDGEIVELALDAATRVEIMDDEAPR